MKRYKLKGLSCAKCAANIEEELKKHKGFAAVNFATSELVVDADEEEVLEVVKRVEPEVEVIKIDGMGEGEEEEETDTKKEVVQIAVAGILFGLGLIFEQALHTTPVAEYALFLSAYLIAGHRILVKAVKNLRRGVVFDENFLISIATIGAVAIHEMPEAVAVMLFFRVGEFMQDLAVGKSRRSIKSLLAIKAEYANLKVKDEIRRVKPEDVRVGDLIVVKPGERIPLDGVVVEGSSVVDTSALTGESKPREVAEGEEVLSGMVNLSGLLTVRVTKPFSASTVSRILELVEEASSRKAKAEKFMTKFARYYTPAVIALASAIAVIPPFVLGEHFTTWIYRALVLLVISCPCALVVSIPLSYFAAIGKAARKGILIKGANFIDVLKSTRVVAMDKTGTLTGGSFKVAGVVAVNGFKEEDVLKFAAIAETHSNHPIARSVVEAYGGDLELKVEEYREIAGRGVVASANGFTVVAGNDLLMHEMEIEHEFCKVEGTVVHVAVNGKYAGYIIVADQLKEDAKQAVEELKAAGCKVVMLTGDSKEVAETIAAQLGIEYFAELLPEDKVRVIEEIQTRERPVAFVGDGINDAPVIARADVGVSMGAMGSDAAIEVADVVIMDDRPSKVPKAIKLARKTQKVVWENIGLALAVKGFFVALGTLGMATMWEAVFADVGVTLIAVANSMRLLR
ncbi:MAG: Heavy metal-(Cd/Co/Hg/Pb/Zn)-translocating P-type ATPase [Archaeoglobus fulgidus]|uniref:Heavy metal-(Cd/Co/Hg/Pb/Zn)-translocating P-type ATPase n=1 Tax=Archaeoglobus fulgidus TaxID=2234 RepID=A0A101E2W0_ARCFL|nr:heavy metal translocating P-type ATPase [Archaeoglobus fulgidus]KUJ94301.1 MAG: Heavy metal-(Cd/Co/Hg/Pb/Zn)-translocating P-type ATPase [Archaeoglobus fulgidus]KUK07576.1 MAG: Heavy metal-(Cd/Co/Hg/Pb/Zn)-translocating P-type ATPase [Archaeoglobus fulgidus]